MKVGILNFQYSNHNYGAVLQACAINEKLVELGINAEHINYIPQVIEKNFIQKIRFLAGQLLRELGLRKKIIDHNAFKNPNIFEEFRNQWLPRSKKIYNSLEDLKEDNLTYTHVIVGSDQVWRPSYTNNSMLVYFLTFLEPSIKRISYAASFGIDKWEYDRNTEQTQQAKKEIGEFSAISVREESGLRICKEMFGVEAQHVLDPTLLIGRDYFEKIINSSNRLNNFNLGKNKIIYYKLDVDVAFSQFVKSIGKKFNADLENIYYKKIDGENYYYPVETWLHSIKYGEVIVTDSFHCVCFAILFEKEFIYYPAKNNRGMSRIESLFSSLDITGRIVYDPKNVDVFIQKMCRLDYALIKEKLSIMRASSLEFLNASLR